MSANLIRKNPCSALAGWGSNEPVAQKIFMVFHPYQKCYIISVSKRRVYLTYLFRLGLQILVLEAAFLAFTWLLNQYLPSLQRVSFGDALFIMGALASAIGCAGMFRSPYWVPLSPMGVWASSTQANEEEKRTQLVDELMHQTSFGLRILAIGVITILVSIAVTYIL